MPTEARGLYERLIREPHHYIHDKSHLCPMNTRSWFSKTLPNTNACTWTPLDFGGRFWTENKWVNMVGVLFTVVTSPMFVLNHLPESSIKSSTLSLKNWCTTGKVVNQSSLQRGQLHHLWRSWWWARIACYNNYNWGYPSIQVCDCSENTG